MSDYIQIQFDGRDTPLSMPICQITRDDNIENGEPVISGIRVSCLYAMNTNGYSLSQISDQYPTIEIEHIRAALHYAYDHEDEMKEYLRGNDEL